AALAALLVRRERRAEDPIVPLGMLRSKAVGVASGALFLTTASLFAVVVFVPLFLQATTGATPTEAGLLMAPMMLGTTISTSAAASWARRRASLRSSGHWADRWALRLSARCSRRSRARPRAAAWSGAWTRGS